MKIAIVGNSHAGAFRQALLHDADRYPHTFDFFIQTGGDAPRLEQRDNRLHPLVGANPMSLGKGYFRDGFDPKQYDAILFVALGLPAKRMAFGKHLLNNFLHAGFAAQPYRDHQSVSGEVFALMMAHRLLTQHSMKSMQLVRSLFAGPLVIVTSPVPGAVSDDGKPCDLPAQYGARLPAFMSWYFNEQIRVIAAEADRVGAMILSPPAAFIAAGASPGELCSRDRWHMIRDYGHLMLANAVRLLDGKA